VAKSRRRGRAPAGLSDLLVLDADGVAKAVANDPRVPAWLERARELDADVIVSAVTLAEVVRARQAGRLLGKAGSEATIDAFVAATAVAGRERHGATHCVVLTSDPHDLRVLLADEPAVRVVAV
jgi:hypothetical protein